MGNLVMTIKLYDDGSYEIINANSEHQNLRDNDNDLIETIFRFPAASTRTKVNVSLYKLAKSYYEKGNISYFDEAVDAIASYQNVERATVTDKLFRQNEVTAERYKSLLDETLSTNDVIEYRNLLLSSVGKRTTNADTSLIMHHII